MNISENITQESSLKTESEQSTSSSSSASNSSNEICQDVVEKEKKIINNFTVLNNYDKSELDEQKDSSKNLKKNLTIDEANSSSSSSRSSVPIENKSMYLDDNDISESFIKMNPKKMSSDEGLLN